MLDGLRGSSLEAAISDLSEGLDDLRNAVDEQGSTLARIDARSLATLNGIRTLLEHRADAGLHCPSLFEVIDVGRTGFPPQQTFQLRLWCEWPYGPHGPHPLAGEDGVYLVRRLPGWLRNYLPYLSTLATALGIVAPLAVPGLTAAGMHLNERTSAAFETVVELAQDLKESTPRDGLATDSLLHGEGLGPRTHADVSADFRALRAALTELDKHQQWGGLSPVERPEDRRIVYLCRQHVRALDYPYRP